MKITVIGTGYVGLVTGTCLAEMGNHVMCLDLDREKIRILEEGGIPIHEPGLLDMVTRNRAAGRLQFTTDIDRAVAHARRAFVPGRPAVAPQDADLRRGGPSRGDPASPARPGANPGGGEAWL